MAIDIEGIFQTAAETIHDTMGISATYYPRGSTKQSINVIFIEKRLFEPVGVEGRYHSNEVRIQILKSELSKEPEKGERIVIATGVWSGTYLVCAKDDDAYKLYWRGTIKKK